MPDELQTEAQATESPETGADLAPATGENLEQNDSVTPAEEDKDPAGFTKAIHRKHYELMEERRKNEALTQTVARLQTEHRPERPTVPEVPDPYADDFEQQVVARDAAVQAAANFDAKQAVQVQQRNDKAAQTLQEKQQQSVQREQVFSERAKAGGMTDSDISTSIQTVAAYGGVGEELAGFLLEHEQGPGITAHLAKNPGEILKIQAMTPMQGAVYLSTIAPTVPKNTGAPAPVDSLGGGGAPKPDDGPPGVTYE